MLQLRLAKDSKPARLLGELARNVGMRLDIDALATSNQKVFRARATEVMVKFYSKQRRVMIIDDLNSLLSSANAREFNQIQAILDAASSISQFEGGKIIAISSRHLPRTWTSRPRVKQIRLRGEVDPGAGTRDRRS